MPEQDPFLSYRNWVARLYEEFRKYGTLIFCVDFDNTIYDYHRKCTTYPKLIALLKRWEPYARIIIHTSRGPDDYPMIESHCNNIGLKIMGINCQSSVRVSGPKPYANVYIDDRAGLPMVYQGLLEIIEKIEANPPKPSNTSTVTDPNTSTLP